MLWIPAQAERSGKYEIASEDRIRLKEEGKWADRTESEQADASRGRAIRLMYGQDTYRLWESSAVKICIDYIHADFAGQHSRSYLPGYPSPPKNLHSHIDRWNRTNVRIVTNYLKSRKGGLELKIRQAKYEER